MKQEHIDRIKGYYDMAGEFKKNDRYSGEQGDCLHKRRRQILNKFKVDSAAVPVEPGLTNAAKEKDGISQVIVNVEAQKGEPTGCHILNRAVFESTLNLEIRRKGGMHYTSIENIHKVIDTLFLDELKNELETIKEITVERTRNIYQSAPV